MTGFNLTIKDHAEAETIIKKSRFVTHAFRIHDEEEALADIERVAHANPKANHNCFAYMLGDDDHLQRKSDNGEPSGTAGLPILDAIKGQQLHNVLVVVTRYFGGIKLGSGGLIRAYSNSATNGLNTATIVNRVLQTKLTITLAYAQFDSLTHFLEERQISIQDTQYAETIQVTIAIDSETVPAISAALVDAFNDTLTLTPGAETMTDAPYHKNA